MQEIFLICEIERVTFREWFSRSFHRLVGLIW